MTHRPNTLARGIFSVGVWNLAKILASAALTAVLARTLGAGGYGQYAFYIALIGMAWPLANLGSSQTLTREIAQRPDDARYRRQILRALALLNLAGTLLTGGAVLAWLLWAERSPAAVLSAGLVVGAIAGEQAILFAKGVLLGLRRADLVSLPAAIGQVLAAALAILSAWLGLGIPGVLAAICATNLLTAAVTLRFALGPGLERAADTPAPAPAQPAPDHELHIPALLRFSLSSTLYVALAFVLYRADLLLLRHLAGDVQAGLYAAAVQWAEFVWFVPLAVQEVVLQAAARLWQEGRPGALAELLERLMRYVALIAGLMLAMVVALAEPLVTLYFGPEFGPASLAMRILAPGVLSFSLARVMVPAIQARSTRAMVAVISATVVGNLALNALLIPRWGAVGAALACSVSYGWVAFFYLGILRRYGAAPPVGRLVRVALLALATAGLTLPVALLIAQPLLAIAVGGLVGAAIYVSGILWLGLLSPDEIQLLLQRLPARLRRPRRARPSDIG